MYKVLFTAFGVPVLSYTVLCIAAMFGSMLIVKSEAGRLRWGPTNWLVVRCTLFGFVGSHLLFMITRWELPWDEWFRGLINIGYGHVWFGGFLLSWAYCHWYAKKHGIPRGQMYDVGAFAVLVAQIVGRFGCLLNGCCYGSPTGLPWGIVIPTREYFNSPVHPAPLYESIYQGIVLLILWRKRKTLKEGDIFVRYLFFVPLGRFFLEFIRGDTIRGTIFGVLTTSQAISLALIAVSVYFMMFLKARDSRSASS